MATAVLPFIVRICSVLQCVAACCSFVVGFRFDCVAVWRNVLQTAGVDGKYLVVLNCAYCSVLQCCASLATALPRLPLLGRWRQPFFVAVCCSALQCMTVCCSVLQCATLCCSVLQYFAVQCVAVCCSVLQCVAVCYVFTKCCLLWVISPKISWRVTCVAVFCKVMQCASVTCAVTCESHVLQWVAVC